MLRRTLICSAFATWCFLNTWVELAEGNGPYFARHDPMRAVVVPVVCWQILLTITMLAAWSLWRRIAPRRTTAGHLAFLLSSLVPLGIASVALLRALPFDLVPLVRNRLFWPVAMAAGITPCVFAIARPAAASRLLRGVFLYSWPLLAVIWIQAWRSSLRFPAAMYADGPLAATNHSPAPRIRAVWVIFDELSQQIAFDRRPASVQLPNLDRLRAESFGASAARSPSDGTETSLPSLIIGKRVTAVSRPAPNRLMLTMEGSPAPIDLSKAPNVFDAARRMGYDTALVGWFHPYGRLLNGSLTRCHWTAGWLLSGIEEPTTPRSLLAGLADRAALQFITLPLIGHVPGVNPGGPQRESKRERFSYLLDRAVEIAKDPQIGLALIHLPVPHPPAFYSRSARQYTANGRLNYLDGVSLADEALGVLRHELEAAGEWDKTALLVSSDHGWRTNLWRGGPDWTAEEETAAQGGTLGVPFLLKLPGQRTTIHYGTAFDTVISGRLITAILDGTLTDPTQVADEIATLRSSLLVKHR